LRPSGSGAALELKQKARQAALLDEDIRVHRHDS
jgi:hypothetical protein